MPRTPIPKHLIHKPEEVEENAKLFDGIVNLIPEYPYEDFKEIRELMVSNLLENIRQKVEKEGKLLLPFNLVVRHNS